MRYPRKLRKNRRRGRQEYGRDICFARSYSSAKGESRRVRVQFSFLLRVPLLQVLQGSPAFLLRSVPRLRRRGYPPVPRPRERQELFALQPEHRAYRRGTSAAWVLVQEEALQKRQALSLKRALVLCIPCRPRCRACLRWNPPRKSVLPSRKQRHLPRRRSARSFQPVFLPRRWQRP